MRAFTPYAELRTKASSETESHSEQGSMFPFPCPQEVNSARAYFGCVAGAAGAGAGEAAG